jgi:hypothetical protein
LLQWLRIVTIVAVNDNLRDRLVSTALEWQHRYGNAPAVTGALGEYDAAMLVGCNEREYRTQMQTRSVVAPDYDFEHQGRRYQVKATRPSGRRGSEVTKVPRPGDHGWDFFLWLNYDERYDLKEAWRWRMSRFRSRLGHKTRLSPSDLRQGTQLYP